MPQSLAAAYLHIVFSTKNREPTIDPAWAENLYAYIGGIAKGIFNPDTLEFYLTWDHLFGERRKSGLATFSLYGKVNMVDVAAVPLATTAVLFGTGLAVLMTVWRRKGSTQRGQSVQSA